jgi:7-cyano-7-deazaguanine synthase
MTKKGCVVLLSGGLDSTVMLYGCVMSRGAENVFPLYVNYGSKHKSYEFAAAQITCKELGLTLREVEVSKNIFSNAALTDPNVKVPSDLKDTINVVVPFRNLSLATFGAMYADMVGVSDIFLSPTKEDFDVFRDCRRDFFDMVEATLELGSKREGNYFVLTPHIQMTKAEVIQRGIDLDVNFLNTWTCYDPQAGKPCKVCPACQVRAKGFNELGVVDPWTTA